MKTQLERWKSLIWRRWMCVCECVCVTTYGERTNVVQHTMSSWLMEWIHWFWYVYLHYFNRNGVDMWTLFIKTQCVSGVRMFLKAYESIWSFIQSEFGIIYPIQITNIECKRVGWIRMSSFRILIKSSGQIETIIPNSKIIPTFLITCLIYYYQIIQIAQIHSKYWTLRDQKHVLLLNAFEKKPAGHKFIIQKQAPFDW